MLEFLSGLTVSAVAMALLWFLASVVLVVANIVAVALFLRLVSRPESWRILWHGTPPMKISELSGKLKVLGNELGVVTKLQEVDNESMLTIYERLKDIEQKHDQLAGAFGQLLLEEPEGFGGEEDE